MSYQSGLDHLFRHDWTVLERFVDSAQTSKLLSEAQGLWSQGRFLPASVGKGAMHARREEIRSDSICWFSDEPTATQRDLQQAFERLRQTLNVQAYLGLVEVECHFARYGAGDSYAKHLDRFRSDDRRVVSAVLYLNERWRAEDGGELRLFPPDGDAVQIRPHAGTLVVFLSDRVAHEVLPVRRERWSVAAWFRRRSAGGLP